MGKLRVANKQDFLSSHGYTPNCLWLGVTNGNAFACVIKADSGDWWLCFDQGTETSKFALHRGAMALMGLAEMHGVDQVFALEDDEKATSAKWLERLGFKRYTGLTWIWRIFSQH